MPKLVCCLSIAFSLVAHLHARETPAQQAAPAPAAAQSPETQSSKITPSDVYRQVALFREEIKLIRLEMGKPQVSPSPIQVDKAAPREVYFQALTLFRKADRLAFESTREEVDEPPLPLGQIQPADVEKIVVAALDRVRSVKESLAITEQSTLPARDPDIEPSQVFNAIIAANREVNSLLGRRFAPDDVYQQVTTAIAYAARLLDSPDALSTPPDPPPLERRKRPEDVYRKLINCFEQIHEIGNKSGVTMLDLEVDEQKIEGVEPGDVYDVASLLVAELAHLHQLQANAAPPRKAFPPGRKLPSHVYQRIGILCGQLETLQEKVDSNPDWLNN